MTIKEYRKKFIELFEQLEAEHGDVETVRIYKHHFQFATDDARITITFGREE